MPSCFLTESSCFLKFSSCTLRCDYRATPDVNIYSAYNIIPVVRVDHRNVFWPIDLDTELSTETTKQLFKTHCYTIIPENTYKFYYTMIKLDKRLFNGLSIVNSQYILFGAVLFQLIGIFFFLHDQL